MGSSRSRTGAAAQQQNSGFALDCTISVRKTRLRGKARASARGRRKEG